MTVTNEKTANYPDYVIESPNLIGGQLPSSVGSGNFTMLRAPVACRR